MDTITIGQLNSELGKMLAETLRKSAILEIADWCATAEQMLAGNPAPDAQADAGLYQDAACALRAIAKFAA